MSADHTDHAAGLVAHGRCHIDETERLVVRRGAEERGKKLGLMHIADGGPFKPVLEPRTCLNGLTLQHALRRGADRSIGRGVADPGIIGIGGPQLLKHLTDDFRVSRPDVFQRRHGCQIADFPVAFEHSAIQDACRERRIVGLVAHDNLPNPALRNISASRSK